VENSRLLHQSSSKPLFYEIENFPWGVTPRIDIMSPAIGLFHSPAAIHAIALLSKNPRIGACSRWW
jgi:hypothetical protein